VSVVNLRAQHGQGKRGRKERRVSCGRWKGKEGEIEKNEKREIQFSLLFATSLACYLLGKNDLVEKEPLNRKLSIKQVINT
jgi:hypothetical protein